jgi:hypothetical protein
LATQLEEAFTILVPVAVVCQYHVTPAPGLPLKDKVFGPQAFADITGTGGAAGGVQVVTSMVVCVNIPPDELSTNIK